MPHASTFGSVDAVALLLHLLRTTARQEQRALDRLERLLQRLWLIEVADRHVDALATKRQRPIHVADERANVCAERSELKDDFLAVSAGSA
jgi:ABC-type branched-subunit amino acid transport system ATPase component